MCGRFQLEVSLEDLEKYYNIIDQLTKSQGKAPIKKGSLEMLSEAQGIKYPSQDSLAVTSDSLSLIKWGFPFNGKLIINSREETLLEKKLYSTLLKEKRCLIPTTGFFEWKDKKKYLIAPEGSKVFSLAGIYNSFINKEGSLEKRFTIITTAANKKMSTIHHRMPVIIPSSLEKSYLDQGTPIIDIKAMLSPYNDLDLCIWPCDNKPEQMSLFS